MNRNTSRLLMSAVGVLLLPAIVNCGGDGSSAPLVAAPAPAASAPAVVQTSAAIEGLVVGDPETVLDQTDPLLTKSFVRVKMLTQGKVASIRSESVATAQVGSISTNLVRGALVSYEKHPTTADMVKAATTPSMTFGTVYASNRSGSNFTFDSKLYGPELLRLGTLAGKMAAAGWVYAKDGTARTITVGDGRIVEKDLAGRAFSTPIKRYEETYTVADDVQVYSVNTDNYDNSAISTFSAIPVTPDYKYSTIRRQQAYFVFDKSHKEAAGAKVVAIYYFTPQSTTTGKPVHEIGNNSSILDGLGTVPASESALYAGVRYNDILYVNINYEQSTEPFEVVKGTLYSVGDNEVHVYVFKTDSKLILFDAGWPTLGYQYWKNIEAVGLDPRKITDIMLSHAHGDHYGTAVELISMIENAGGSVTVWGTDEELNGIRTDAQGNVWNKAPTLPASQTVLRQKTSVFYEPGKVYDFGNVRLSMILTPGHTNGTSTFYWDVRRPETQQFVRFAYQGGYGWSPLRTANTNVNGWLRLMMPFTLSYLQQADTNVIPLPQHTDMAPLLEAYQAVKAYNRDPANASSQKTVMDALTTATGGVNEFSNLMEKRYQSFMNPLTDSVNGWKSIPTYGPYKPGRENGLSNVSVNIKDSGKIIRGFNKHWLINTNFPLLKDGIVFEAEAYMHDPGAYYVQFYADVQDAVYKGFMPEGYRQTVAGVDLTYTGGPVESIYAGTGTPEVIRTQRLNSLAEAQAILQSVRQGGTYKVDLTKTSVIIVPSDISKTFRP